MSCLNGLVTSISNSYRAVTFTDSQGVEQPIAEGGYYSVMACLTPPGLGYTSAGAVECSVGSYNEGGNLQECRP
jgi:hypothetical protein